MLTLHKSVRIGDLIEYLRKSETLKTDDRFKEAKWRRIFDNSWVVIKASYNCKNVRMIVQNAYQSDPDRRHSFVSAAYLAVLARFGNRHSQHPFDD